MTPFPPAYQVHSICLKATCQYTATFPLKEQMLYFCRSVLREPKSFEDNVNTLHNPYLHTGKTARVLPFQSIYNIHAKKATVLSRKGIRLIFQSFSLSQPQPSCWLALLINFLHLFSQSKQFTSLPPILKKQKQPGQEFEASQRKRNFL